MCLKRNTNTYETTIFTRKCTHLSCLERKLKGKMCWIGEEIEIKNKKFYDLGKYHFPTLSRQKIKNKTIL